MERAFVANANKGIGYKIALHLIISSIVLTLTSCCQNREESPVNFRMALSLSPFSLGQFDQGYSFEVEEKTATTPEELQSIYRELGATEMFVRIATKRHVTDEDLTNGKPDPNANVHTFDQGIQLCQIAATLDIPINPEIMCAYTYMDMAEAQAPRFEEYPEIYALQKGKPWSELTLDEICTVLEAYGTFVSEQILKTGCTVNDWNLGNEANFGFAGISISLETAVNPSLRDVSEMDKYIYSVASPEWLKENLWQYEAKALAAVRRGILNTYSTLGKDTTNVRFSTHIATVVASPNSCVEFFKSMTEYGYDMDVTGISYYPSAPSAASNRWELLTETVTLINEQCHKPVFIAEFSYPSGEMDGPFASWNEPLEGYEKTERGQAELYAAVIDWGKTHGIAGIRYWAPDFEGWYSMAMFNFEDKKGFAKEILKRQGK